MNRQIYLKTFLYFVCVSQGYKRIQEKTCSYLFFSFKQAFKAKKKLKEKTMNCYLVWKHSAPGHFCIKRREKDSRKVILDFASSETRKQPLSFRSILAPKALFSVRNLRSIMKKKKKKGKHPISKVIPNKAYKIKYKHQGLGSSKDHGLVNQD